MPKRTSITGSELFIVDNSDHDFEALRDFIHAHEGETTPIETMHLEYQKLLQDHPELASRLDQLPGRVFSGKEHPAPGTNAVFFCYTLPAPRADLTEAENADAAEWTEEAGRTAWYLYDLANGVVIEEPTEIVGVIRSDPETPRRCIVEQATLAEIRAKIEKHIKNSYLKKVQAPVGVKPVLKAWMEVS